MYFLTFHFFKQLGDCLLKVISNLNLFSASARFQSVEIYLALLRLQNLRRQMLYLNPGRRLNSRSGEGRLFST